MNLEDVEVGMKVKVVSLKNTHVGGLPVKIGDIVEVYGVGTKCCGDNNTLALFDEWSISHLDVEPFEEDSSINSQDNDLVNSPKHYATDLSGVECIQIKRKMSTNAGDAEDSQAEVGDNSKVKQKPFKSDGGSSPYYFSVLPQHVIDRIVEKGGIEIKDIIRYCFDNDADCKDIIKALKRIRECKKGGGKEGIDVMYDTTKVKFFADEMYDSEKANCG